MLIFLLAGPSGVGKTHLALELESHGFHTLETYTDRAPRGGESAKNSNAVCISASEFDAAITGEEFVYWFNFGGKRYGYKHSDIAAARQRGVAGISLVTTGTDAYHILDVLPEAATIYLAASADEEFMLQRLLQRDELLARQGFFKLSPALQADYLAEHADVAEKLAKVQTRLQLNREAAQELLLFRQRFMRHQASQVFTVTDDKVLYDEVIPHILHKITQTDQ